MTFGVLFGLRGCQCLSVNKHARLLIFLDHLNSTEW